jgi:hypothetical protein
VAEQITGTAPATTPAAKTSGTASAAGSVASTISAVGSLVPKLPTDPLTGALDVAAAALQMGLTVEEFVNTPEYEQAVLAERKKADIDRIRANEQKAEQGDPNALNNMRENVS